MSSPPRDIVDLIESTNKGEHVPVYHGDPRRVGVVDRWYWSCRCGSGSARMDMTIKQAHEDFARHALPA